ncbi:hypothetical protein JCM19236_2087 [Vibrio sp. JCM 19236]|nr:hypothetical protein JCM19236_2087 [Vibrio sp. JCM 19236]
MQDEANKGNPQFIQNIRDGHHLSYLEDIAYIRVIASKS